MLTSAASFQGRVPVPPKRKRAPSPPAPPLPRQPLTRSPQLRPPAREFPAQKTTQVLLWFGRLPLSATVRVTSSHTSVVHASLLLSRLRRVPVSHWLFLFFVFVFVFLAIRNTAALDVCRSQYCDYGLSFLLPRYLGAESLGRGAGRTPRAPVRSSYDVVVPLTSDPRERLASPAALI